MKKNLKKFIYIIPIFICMFVAFSVKADGKPLKKMEITAINLESTKKNAIGDAILLSSNKKYLLMDCGLAQDSERVLPDALKNENIEKLDVYISHLHEDHCGGLETVLKNFEVDTIYLPQKDFLTDATNLGGVPLGEVYENIEGMAEDFGAQIVYLKRGDKFYVGDAAVKIIGPKSPVKRQQGMSMAQYINNNSLAAMITCGKVKYLSIGDLYIAGEKELMKYAKVKATILKLGHHAQDTSSGKKFLKAVGPSYVIACTKNYSEDVYNTLSKMVPKKRILYTSQKKKNIKLICSEDGTVKVKLITS